MGHAIASCLRGRYPMWSVSRAFVWSHSPGLVLSRRRAGSRVSGVRYGLVVQYWWEMGGR